MHHYKAAYSTFDVAKCTISTAYAKVIQLTYEKSYL